MDGRDRLQTNWKTNSKSINTRQACSQLCILPAKMASGPKGPWRVVALRETKLVVDRSSDSFGRHAGIYRRFVSWTSVLLTSACKRKSTDRPAVGAERVETNPKYSLHILRKCVRHTVRNWTHRKQQVWRLVWKRFHLHAYRTRNPRTEQSGITSVETFWTAWMMMMMMMMTTTWLWAKWPSGDVQFAGTSGSTNSTNLEQLKSTCAIENWQEQVQS